MRIRALTRLNEFFVLSPDSHIHPEIAQHFRRNFLVNVGDQITWLFGASFASVNAVLPVFATHFTASPIIIGLIPAVSDAGWFLPQLFLAPAIERLPRKKPLVMVLTVFERIPYLLLPAAALWLAGVPRGLAVTVFMALITFRAFASGLVAAPWQELMAKVIPVTHRGRFFGTGHWAGQLLGVAGSAVAALLLAKLPYPQNFAACFAVGAVGIWISFVFLGLTVEPHLPIEPRAPHSNREYAGRLLNILKGDANFRTFLLSRWLWYFGGMAFGFMAVYAVQHFHQPDSTAAVFTGILYAAGVIGFAVWGPIGDRVGHKRVMEIAGLLWLVALGAALFSTAVWGFYIVFALMGLSSAGGILADLNIAMEFGPENDRPTYIGLARTTTGPALLIAPLLGGWIAQTFSYPALFGVSLGCAVLGLVVLAVRVREPRHIKRGE